MSKMKNRSNRINNKLDTIVGKISELEDSDRNYTKQNN